MEPVVMSSSMKESPCIPPNRMRASWLGAKGRARRSEGELEYPGNTKNNSSTRHHQEIPGDRSKHQLR